MASRYSKISTLDELDRSLASVRGSIEAIEASYLSTATDFLSGTRTALEIFQKVRHLFSKK